TCLLRLSLLNAPTSDLTPNPLLLIHNVMPWRSFVRVLQPLSILIFEVNCPNVFLSGCVLAFLKFLEGKEILKNNFSRVGEVEALTTALACGSALRGFGMCLHLCMGYFTTKMMSVNAVNVCGFPL